jgi:hypothetical protein
VSSIRFPTKQQRAWSPRLSSRYHEHLGRFATWPLSRCRSRSRSLTSLSDIPRVLRAQLRSIYRTYPVYAPGHEPAGLPGKPPAKRARNRLRRLQAAHDRGLASRRKPFTTREVRSLAPKDEEGLEYTHGNKMRKMTVSADEFLGVSCCIRCRAASSASAPSDSSPDQAGPSCCNRPGNSCRNPRPQALCCRHLRRARRSGALFASPIIVMQGLSPAIGPPHWASGCAQRLFLSPAGC